MDIDLERYKLLSERHLNDDRLLNERGSAFLSSSSILFAGFAVFATIQNAGWILILIPILGIVVSILALMANCRTANGLTYWDQKQCIIETESIEEPFTRMRQQQMNPSAVYKHLRLPLRNRVIFSALVPSVFAILWICSLIWVCAG